MELIIRQAKQSEAVKIAPLIYDAIGEIANRLTGEQEKDAILTTLTELVTRTDNRHSYLNTHVAIQEEQLLGIVVLYDGLSVKELDANLMTWLKEKQVTSTIDVEAHDDEYYLDTICVAPKARRLGIGSKLLAHTEQVARDKGFKKLSLNVELEKTKARALYERVGFVITEPWTIIDEPFHHMVKTL